MLNRSEMAVFPAREAGRMPGMIRAALIAVLALVALPALPAQTAVPKNITPAEAANHLMHRSEPTVPPLARLAKVGGTVKLHIIISTVGDVSSVKVISGHPLLIGSAVESVKKWKYRPFVEAGKTVAVATDIEIAFPGGMSKEESTVRDSFYPAEDKCRNLLQAQSYGEAERECRMAVEISNKLPEGVILERSEARALLGNVIFLQRRFQEAIPLYDEALTLDKSYLKSDDADLATDYSNLGRAYAMVGELAKADELYATAVSTFEAAIKDLPQLKQNYTRRLKRALNEYAQIKDAEGESEAARQLRTKAGGL